MEICCYLRHLIVANSIIIWRLNDNIAIASASRLDYALCVCGSKAAFPCALLVLKLQVAKSSFLGKA